MSLRSRAAAGCLAFSGCISPLGVVCAQPSENPPLDLPPDELLEEVIVTGTRLPMLEKDAPAAVTVLDRIDVERGNKDSVAKILHSLPMNTGAQINTNTEAGFGSARVNLRGLGAERTLVLVNGLPFPNGGLGGDSSVDLNMLAVSMIDRIEVLPSGASAVHGSGAVGGVVNVVMKPSGGGVGASWTVTGQGDGEIATGRAGMAFDLLGMAWTVDVDYVSQKGVTAADRDYSAQPMAMVDPEGTLVFSGQQMTADGMFYVYGDNALGLPEGMYVRIPGATGQTAADYRLFTPADGYNAAMFNYSQLPNERGSFWVTGSRDFDNAAHLRFEAYVNQRDSSLKATPDHYSSDGDGYPLLADGSPGIPMSNFFNPFGVGLPYVARRFEENGTRRGIHDVDMWRVVAAGSGKLRSWEWELTTEWSESDSVNRSVGGFARSRYFTALGPAGPDDSGQIVCGTPDPATGIVPPDEIIPGCVPLNLFGGNGSITQDQLDYMSPRTLVDRGTNDHRTASAVLKGSWGQVLQRDVQWVFGVDYRHDAGSWVPDPLRELGYIGLVDPDLQRHSSSSQEFFAESQIPLFHDRKLLLDSSLTIAVRGSDFSSYGRNLSWSMGLTWQPVEELGLRTNFAPVFRAPSIHELHEENTIGQGNPFDPCGNDPTSEQRVHCAADGVPGGAYVQDGREFGIVRGGNPELEPETGSSLTAGMTYTPLWLPGFSLAIDYFRTELESGIGATDAETLLQECANFGTQTACDAIFRAEAGNPILVAAVLRNQGHYKTSGLDFSLEWSRATSLGDFGAGLSATHLQQLEEQPLPHGGIMQQAGEVTLPRWRAGGHVDWGFGGWHASYALEYIGSMNEMIGPFPLYGVLDPFERTIPSKLYQDVEGSFKFASGLALTVGIQNLTDEDPPYVSTGAVENTDPGMYRLLGRTFFFNVSYEFSPP